MRLSQSATVRAPAERVFDCWAALERSPEHQKPTLDRTKLTDGPVGKGTRYSATDQWPGRKVSFEMEITGFERPSSISASWDQPMNGSWTARFEESDGTTLMDFETIIEPGGVMGLLAPLMKPWANRQLSQGLASFANWVENGGC